MVSPQRNWYDMFGPPIIAVYIFCILLWVVYPAHSCPKKCVAQHVSSSDARGSKVCFTGRIGWIAPLPTICRSFFKQETVPYQCSFTQLLDANIIFSNQESLPGYSWGGCGKSYAFTRFTTTAILPGNPPIGHMLHLLTPTKKRELSQQFLGFHHVSKGKAHMSTPWKGSNGTEVVMGL